MTNEDLARMLEKLADDTAAIVDEIDRQRGDNEVSFTHYNRETVSEMREMAQSYRR